MHRVKDYSILITLTTSFGAHYLNAFTLSLSQVFNAVFVTTFPTENAAAIQMMIGESLKTSTTMASATIQRNVPLNCIVYAAVEISVAATAGIFAFVCRDQALCY